MNQFAYAGSANQRVHAVKIRGGTLTVIPSKITLQIGCVQKDILMEI